jgi:hypothetical protein
MVVDATRPALNWNQFIGVLHPHVLHPVLHRRVQHGALLELRFFLRLNIGYLKVSIVEKRC